MDAPPIFEQSRPTLEVADLAVALAFLRDVVGMPVAVVEGDPPTFAIVGPEGADLGLVQVPAPAVPVGAACYVTMTGLDGLVARLRAAGIDLEVPLTTRPWGLRDLVVVLPGGGPMVAFGERVRP